MALTVGNLIDRLQRDYLYPPTERPLEARVTSTLAAAATTLTLDDGWLPAEAAGSIGPGTIIEAGSELIRVRDYNDTTRVFTNLERGAFGTTDVEHTGPFFVTFNPPYTRLRCFDAIADSIVALWPWLFGVTSQEITTQAGYIEVPADVEEVIEVRYRDSVYTDDTLTTWPEGAFEFIRRAPFTDTTGKAIVLYGVPTARTAYVTYRHRFSRPTAESHDITATGNDMEEAWADVILLGALLRVLGTTSIVGSRIQSSITDALESQGFPPAEGERLDRHLVRVYEYLLQTHAARLKITDPGGIEMLPAW